MVAVYLDICVNSFADLFSAAVNTVKGLKTVSVDYADDSNNPIQSVVDKRRHHEML